MDSSENTITESYTHIVIGLVDTVNHGTAIDIEPFPPGIGLSGEGVTFSDKINKAYGGVIEAKFESSNWEHVLNSYNEYLKAHNKTPTYCYVVCDDILVFSSIDVRFSSIL
ncbi:hypothetical protein [Pectobacterium versatile]|uniref:hypothetical protein n=1 Tax=Pectobacterium versatile TaxID=2488639 RepID=UPI0011AF93E1|nr:hypothetical protein [Pectobacterium versatile]